MNPITFNEPFEMALRKLQDRDLEAKMERWRTSPLFVHETTITKERDFLLNADLPNSDMAEVKWPFPVLRLALTEHVEPEDELYKSGIRVLKSNMIASRVSDEEIRVFSNHLKFGLSNGRMRQLEPVFTLSTSTPSMGGLITWVYIKNGWSRSIVVGIDSDPSDSRLFNTVPLDSVKELSVSRVATVMAFMITATAPRVHIATVTPQLPGKSVEWQKARMHYTLISHGHPANKAGISPGAEIESDAAEEIERIAHDRRGHWRNYRHERYRFARGKWQWIKATWIGPKEWRSAGGQQIYRILEPVI
jgi:hypothetical protein